MNIAPEDNILLAVSGGPDSMALLDMVRKLSQDAEFSFAVAHVNYGVRKQSLLEEETLRHYCLSYDIPFFSRKVSLPHTNSFEEKAREFRYNFFRELAISFGFNKVFTAHNQDDQAETILIRLFRGTGPKGAVGIRKQASFKSMNLVRPFLKVSKKELISYCIENRVPYFIDETNQTSVYNRNFIRNNIIPLVKKRYNRVNENLCRFSEALSREDSFSHDMIRFFYDKWSEKSEDTVELESQIFKDPDFFQSEGFNLKQQSCNYVKGMLIRFAINDLKALKDIEETHIRAIETLFKKDSGQIDLPNYLTARVMSGHCQITFRETASEPFSNYDLGYLSKDKTFYFSKEKLKLKVSLNPKKTLNHVLIDGDKIDNSIMLRSKRSGDKVYPVGMEGSKKLSRFFIDKKIPINQRDSIPVLASEHTVIWIPDLYINRNYLADQSTENVLGLTLEQLNE